MLVMSIVNYDRAAHAVGALQAGAATIYGTDSTDIIVRPAEIFAMTSTVDGVGSVTSQITGTGELQVSATELVGSGASSSTGAGELVAGAADVAGGGQAGDTINGGGDLEADAATVAGAGVSGSAGSGELAAGAVTIDGAGSIPPTHEPMLFGEGDPVLVNAFTDDGDSVIITRGGVAN